MAFVEMTLLRGLAEIFWCMEKKLYFCIEVNIILLSSPAFVQLTITDTENFWQRTTNY
ncbi:unnamed protein product [Camellia sinensis]